MIRALIVDDEALARRGVLDLLAHEPDVELLAECRNGLEAVDAIARLRPDLVFLDIQMPEMGGFDVLRATPPEIMPAVVFVTAYDQHAVQAFRVHAVDYLLKPVDRTLFRAAVDRTRRRLAQDGARAVDECIAELLRTVARSAQPGGPDYDRLLVKSDGRAFFVKTANLIRVEAAGNYARLHMGSAIHVIRERLSALEGQLDPRCFFRIHRSSIVNVEYIGEIQPMFKGEHVVILRDGTRLPLGRKYRELLEARLGKPL